MSDLVLILTGALSVLILGLLGLVLYKGRKTSKASEEREAPARAPNVVRNEEQIRVGNRRVVRHRQRANRREEQDSQEEEDDDPLADEIGMPMEGKIGAKKRRKLEMKAEKRAARERELEEREERKQRQAAVEEQRRQEEEKQKAEELLRLEEEKKAKEEKERQELEEYLKLKETFSVEEEGYEENHEEDEVQNKLQTFINYIKENKVVLLEDLAGHFKMKTQDVITRVQDLMAQELLVGVIDDRGKFIDITKEELEAVAKFVRRRGRVSIAELVESSNELINLQPSTPLVAN